MLGCGLEPNTSMHAIEELVVPPYLFNPPREYQLILEDGRTVTKTYLPHNFRGWRQRYDRVAEVLFEPGLRTGPVLRARAYLLDALALHQSVLRRLQENPLYFVDPASTHNSA